MDANKDPRPQLQQARQTGFQDGYTKAPFSPPSHPALGMLYGAGYEEGEQLRKDQGMV